MAKIKRSIRISEQHAASLYALVQFQKKLLIHYHNVIDKDSPIRAQWSGEYCDELMEALVKGIKR